MSKKLLIVTEVFHPESTMINDFIPEVINAGFEVEILTRQPSYPYGKVFGNYKNDYYSVDLWNGVKIHRMKVIEGYRESKIKKILNYWYFVKIGNEIARKIGKNFDHVLIYQTGPLTVALPGVKIKKKYGVPLTVWTCDIWPDAVYAYGFPKIFPIPQIVESIIKKVYRHADRVLISSKNFAETIKLYAKGTKINYTPNWLPNEVTHKSEIKLNEKVFNFLFAGNISVSQNLENVLEGWKKANLSNAHINIVGDGSKLNDLKTIVEKNGISNVFFHGRWPSDQMQSIYSQADVLILPLIPSAGLDKTEPYKIQSYLKAAKPIYGIIEGAGREIVEENELGLCASPFDIEDIAKKFNTIIEFATKNSDRISKNARDLLASRFNREKTIGKIISYIK